MPAITIGTKIVGEPISMEYVEGVWNNPFITLDILSPAISWAKNGIAMPRADALLSLMELYEITPADLKREELP